MKLWHYPLRCTHQRGVREHWQSEHFGGARGARVLSHPCYIANSGPAWATRGCCFKRKKNPKTTKSPAPARLSQLKVCDEKSGEWRLFRVAALERGTDKDHSDPLLPSPDPSNSVLTLGFGLTEARSILGHSALVKKWSCWPAQQFCSWSDV